VCPPEWQPVLSGVTPLSVWDEVEEIWTVHSTATLQVELNHEGALFVSLKDIGPQVSAPVLQPFGV
jgi:hypothetical protein